METDDRNAMNRARAESFGGLAAAYDRLRPSYPPAALDELTADRPADALDVGCGTGRLARQLAERGVAVQGVEVDARMAEVARAHGIPVEVAPFESWDAGSRRFDLISCGQAWHWIDARAGAIRAAQLLRPGRRLALLWNFAELDEPTQLALDDAYREHAPDLLRFSVLRGRTGPATLPPMVEALRASGRFVDVGQHRHDWHQDYSSADWVALSATHSDHITLPDEQRTALLAAVGAAIDSIGGVVHVRWGTHTILARNR
jgi:SAM-dependent methyltransferase